MIVTLDREYWIVERTDGQVLTDPIYGYSGIERITLKAFAGGPVTVLPQGTRIVLEALP